MWWIYSGATMTVTRHYPTGIPTPLHLARAKKDSTAQPFPDLLQEKLIIIDFAVREN